MIRELRHRDPLLFWIGAGFLLTFIVCALVSIGDTRTILGLNPWIKPMKFLISTTIFLWTVAWFMPETTSPRGRAIVRWTIGPAMVIEIACVLLQSARGVASHFNHATPFDDAIFGLMGLTIALNTLAMVLFIAIIRRDTPINREGYIWGIRLGVLLFLAASAQGGVIVANDAHTVGAADGGAGLPFVNWSTEYGDLRIAHFFGMHGMQALPLLGFFLDKAKAPARNVVIAASIVWLAVMGGLLMAALQGRPLLAL